MIARTLRRRPAHVLPEMHHLVGEKTDDDKKAKRKTQHYAVVAGVNLEATPLALN